MSHVNPPPPWSYWYPVRKKPVIAYEHFDMFGMRLRKVFLPKLGWDRVHRIPFHDP